MTVSPYTNVQSQFGGPSVVTGEAIAPNLLLSIDSNGHAVLCGSGGVPVATSYESADSGAVISCYPLHGIGRLTASAAISAGAAVKAAASGKIVSEVSISASTVGVAMEGANLDGDTVLVFFR